MKDILIDFQNKKISLEETEKLLKMNNIQEIHKIANIDDSRKIRTGFPEAILAEGKEYDDLFQIALNSLKNETNKSFSNIIITRLSKEVKNKLLIDLNKEFKDYQDFNFEYNKKAKILIISSKIKENDYINENSKDNKDNKDSKDNKNNKDNKTYKDSKDENIKNKFKIGIVTAGTSDISIGEEARIIIEEGGCEAICSYDVGIAGIHRLFPKIAKMIEENVKVIIVCAGMEGALPSVVAGLVNIPVIGVPTSVGYGIGGKGKAALYAMLQSCAPGLAVVNIDNGFGAAIFALTIVNNL
ncbi:MAG: nickel pincer cofactor biosynthesis protein LarB [Methanobrevibacter sp.]|jgi:NCAIR mutase (PurE)-related protein|nr:nickel pincer cofactor biosynthesis protein LarB [Candidatus Methanoflexus mossambicus]